MGWIYRVVIGLIMMTSVVYAETPRDVFAGGVWDQAASTTRRAPKFLPADQAFLLNTRQEGGLLHLSFGVTAGYYLYQARFQFQPAAGLTVDAPQYSHPPIEEDDPEFGKVKVFDQDVTVSVPVTGQGELVVRYQGCAKAGLCYPPQEQRVMVRPQASVVTPSVADVAHDPRTRLERQAGVQSIRIPLPVPLATIEQAQAEQLSTLPSRQGVVLPVSEVLPPQTSPAIPAVVPLQVDTDPFHLAQHPLTALFLLFMAGLALAFTPCVLPMLPIVANLVARQHRRSAWHGLMLSAAYALGVASSYALLGVLVAMFGRQFNVVGGLQQPSVLIGFAALFALLALNTFDVLPLRLPSFVSQAMGRLGRLGQGEHQAGRVLGSWMTGFFSALVVSPCVSAPLTGVLLSVSTVGDPLLGAAALFMLGLGLSTPLMILGATEGRLLPQSGDWMHWVRQGFGLLLLGVSLVLLGRVFDSSWMLVAWSVLVMLLAAWMWQRAGKGRWVSQAVALVLALWSAILLVGAAQGQQDPWRPLLPTTTQPSVGMSQPAIQVIHQVAELQALQQRTPRLLVDVTADWCVSCQIMERDLFGSQQVAELSGWTRVKLDVTTTDVHSQAALSHLQLFGPPALLFYVQGQAVGRLVGETSAPELQHTLRGLATP